VRGRQHGVQQRREVVAACGGIRGRKAISKQLVGSSGLGGGAVRLRECQLAQQLVVQGDGARGRLRLLRQSDRWRERAEDEEGVQEGVVLAVVRAEQAHDGIERRRVGAVRQRARAQQRHRGPHERRAALGVAAHEGLQHAIEAQRLRGLGGLVCVALLLDALAGSLAAVLEQGASEAHRERPESGTGIGTGIGTSIGRHVAAAQQHGAQARCSKLAKSHLLPSLQYTCDCSRSSGTRAV